MQTMNLGISKEVSKRIAPAYFELQSETQKVFSKNPQKYFQKHEEKMNKSSPEVMRLSLPRRKRWLGLMPISMELGFIQEPEVVEIIVELLSEEDCKISNLARKIAQNSSATRNSINLAASYMPDATTNLGNLDHTLFHHKFEMAGAPLFQITDTLAEQLNDTDIGKSTPCLFLKQPYPMMYIEYGQNPFSGIKIYNRQSQWHDLEGMYLNSVHYPDEQLSEDIDDGLFDLEGADKETKSNMFTHAYQSGHVKKGGGDIQVIEVLATGSPVGKGSNFDDATVFFILIVQDPEMSVQELIDWHRKYYKGELPTQGSLESSLEGIDINVHKSSVMSPQDAESFPKVVEAITKSLLYINSETAIRESVKEVAELKKKINRTSNKAKKRKLLQQGGQALDYIRVGISNNDLNEEISINVSKQAGTKKTHWRRAHFREQAYGKGRALRKIRWIPRRMINANSIIGLDTKPYRVT